MLALHLGFVQGKPIMTLYSQNRHFILINSQNKHGNRFFLI